jgi:hypothetical protein
MKLPRRNFLHLLAGAAALAVDKSEIQWRSRPGLKAIEHLPVATPY